FCQDSLDVDGCCRACLATIRPFPRDRCAQCATPLSQALAPGPCGSCLTQPPAPLETHVMYRYQGAVRDAILAWKLQGEDAGVRWLVESAIPYLNTLLTKHDILIPIPMPLSRMRQHGQHHSADLCRLMARKLACHWDWHILRRQGEQTRQSALPAKQRRKNLRKAFVLNQDYWAKQHGRQGRLWLVDDIITTGSTMHFAAKALRATGVPVYVLSLSKTIQGD
ncbi:MAG: ComF family protein, partial [Mariprofundaceae bacterium]|nr:ComF family protein [Mariprofundaceae bacterium]